MSALKKLLCSAIVVSCCAGCAAGLTACGSSSGNSASQGSTSTGTSSGSSNNSSSGGSTTNLFCSPYTFYVRTDTVTITDSGRAKQHYDVVPLSNVYNLSQLKSAGYTRMKFTYTFDVKEKNDGYQYVFFYYNSSCQGSGIIDKIEDVIYDIVGSDSDPSLLHTEKIEHGPGKKNTKWGSHSFTHTVDLSKLKDDLYIRYGASGSGEDTWYNKNVVLTAEPIKL